MDNNKFISLFKKSNDYFITGKIRAALEEYKKAQGRLAEEEKAIIVSALEKNAKLSIRARNE